jgi:hypothetical protein
VPPAVHFESVIVTGFPEIFAIFREKNISLLWRGSRDGFRARDFHRCCDSYANTLTVILDTNGNIFGGFTPACWQPRGGFSPDPKRQSFLFTLKNPHNCSARIFPLKPDRRAYVITCAPLWGPRFSDIGVYDNCNANAVNFADHFGDNYINDTGLCAETFFTGSQKFTVKEIEVFRLSD